MPLMRAHPGCLSVRIRQPANGQPDVFAITSLWKDLASLQAFAGENWREATILPGEADLLEEVIVQHYDEPHRSAVDTWHAVAEVVRAREAAAMTAPLTDVQWEHLQPLLPPGKKEGRPRADDRRTLDGILYVLRTGCRWRDLPPRYGSAVLLAALRPMGSGRHLGAHLAGPLLKPGRAGQTSVGSGPHRPAAHPCQAWPPPHGVTHGMMRGLIPRP
jgi:hypothetical protein